MTQFLPVSWQGILLPLSPNHLAQVVSALNAVLQLRKDLPDLVIDRIRMFRIRLELLEIRKQLHIHKIDQIIARHRLVMVQLPILILRRRPLLPAKLTRNDRRVTLSRQLRRILFIFLEISQIFQEQNPRSLLHVIQLTGTPRVFP